MKKYIVTRPKAKRQTLSFDDVFLDLIDDIKYNRIMNPVNTTTATRVYEVENINRSLMSSKTASNYDSMIRNMIYNLSEFYERHKHLDIFFDEGYDYEKQIEIMTTIKIDNRRNGIEMSEYELNEKCERRMNEMGLKFNPYYYTFMIPKHSGGYRRIDAPVDELKDALRELKKLFEQMMGGNTYHTSAFAYIPKRSCLDLVETRFKNNGVRWTEKTDFNNFFGSIKYNWSMKQISRIYPFCEIMNDQKGREALSGCMRLCFLSGRLPQGTPISPMLTNILMIPIDFKLYNGMLKNATDITHFDKQHDGVNYKLIYSRYADDIYVGSKVGFNPTEVIDYIKSVLKEFDAPFDINPQKTKYGSNAGKNFILGYMYNAEGNITIGHKQKGLIKAMVNNFALDLKNNPEKINRAELYSTLGYLARYKEVEPNSFETFISKSNEKYGIDVVERMKDIAYNRVA